MAVRAVSLHGFRNHKQLQVTADKNFVIVYGYNGSGKTNLLEALSLLAPGRGLRNGSFDKMFYMNPTAMDSKTMPITQYPQTNEWAIRSTIACGEKIINIASGCYAGAEAGSLKRVVMLDDVAVKHTDILDHLRVLWLTPQMDGIFMDAPALRRRFVDRLAYNFFPQHASAILDYDKLLRSRLKIIQEYKYDQTWLNNVEQQIAHLNYHITCNRKKCLALIEDALTSSTGLFLKPVITLTCGVEACFIEGEQEAPTLILERLKHSRQIDAMSGRSNFGIHKSDLETVHTIKRLPAKQCSTGEQKSMLISMMLAQIRAMRKFTTATLVLLLDEVFAHLDKEAKHHLIDEISALNVQAWLSTSTKGIINDIQYQKDIIELGV